MDVVLVVIVAVSSFFEIARNAGKPPDPIGVQVAAEADADETCASMGELAEKIMQIRQLETPMSKTISDVTPAGAPQDVTRLIRDIIIDAYNQPAMRTEENKRLQVAEFRNDIEVRCFLDLDRAP